MPIHGHHPHGTTVYAPPVTYRAASPASSIGTKYDDDDTSDTELSMSNFEFERMCDEKIKLWDPRPEEEEAEREVLVKDAARGAGGEAEQALFESILKNLRAEIKRLDDEEIYERAMLKGSQIGLEYQPPTTDIDKIMRSMMGNALSLSNANTTPDPGSIPTVPNSQVTDILPSSNDHTAIEAARARSTTKPDGTTINTTLTKDPTAVTSGPWNNYGKKPSSLGVHLFPVQDLSQRVTSPGRSSSRAPRSSLASIMSTTSTTTAGDELMTESTSSHGHTANMAEMGSLTGAPASEGNTSGGTVIGGKRSRNGQTRR